MVRVLMNDMNIATTNVLAGTRSPRRLKSTLHFGDWKRFTIFTVPIIHLYDEYLYMPMIHVSCIYTDY